MGRMRLNIRNGNGYAIPDYSPLIVGFILSLPLLTVADEPLKPANLMAVNTDKDEDDPCASSDGVNLYYSSNADAKWNIMQSNRRARTVPWAAGTPIGGFIQTTADDRSVFVTMEGRFPQYLYYATRKDSMDDASFDIYVAVRQNQKADWTSPTPIDAVCSADDEMHPWLTPDGKHLYFTRKTKEGWRVFVAERSKGTGAAGFGEPKLLDLPAGSHHVTLAPNGQTMYMQGPLEKDRCGLFRCVRTKTGWTTPEPLQRLNSTEAPKGDRSPSLSADGMFLYFASDRPGGKGGLDLWVIPTAELGKAK